jgi:hypothetical protein
VFAYYSFLQQGNECCETLERPAKKHAVCSDQIGDRLGVDRQLSEVLAIHASHQNKTSIETDNESHPRSDRSSPPQTIDADILRHQKNSIPPSAGGGLYHHQTFLHLAESRQNSGHPNYHAALDHHTAANHAIHAHYHHHTQHQHHGAFGGGLPTAAQYQFVAAIAAAASATRLADAGSSCQLVQPHPHRPQPPPSWAQPAIFPPGGLPRNAGPPSQYANTNGGGGGGGSGGCGGSLAGPAGGGGAIFQAGGTGRLAASGLGPPPSAAPWQQGILPGFAAAALPFAAGLARGYPGPLFDPPPARPPFPLWPAGAGGRSGGAQGFDAAAAAAAAAAINLPPPGARDVPVGLWPWSLPPPPPTHDGAAGPPPGYGGGDCGGGGPWAGRFGGP